MREQAKVSATINASAEKVWQGLTDPKLVKQYFFGTDLDTSWKKGSPIFFRGEWEGKKYEDKGEVLSVIPGQQVSYTYSSSMSGEPDRPENYRTVTYELNPKGDTTELTISQESEPDKKTHSEQNWKMILEGLKKVVESKL